MPLNLADWQSYNAVYGTTNNPWDLARTPGGSSGGSARGAGRRPDRHRGWAATSAPRSAIPPHYCGVWGHKPTWGVVPPRRATRCAAPRPDSIGHLRVGPLARGAEDLEIALDAMAGPDAIDGRGWTLDLPRSHAQKKQLRDFKVAVMLDDRNAEVDASVQAAIATLADFLAQEEGAR